MSAADSYRMPYLISQEKHLPLLLLQQYAAGTLSAKEQHLVEAHTLECARCTDILDGLMLSDADITNQVVTGLKQRLYARVTSTKAVERVPRQQWPQIVAAAVLLLALGAVAFFLLNVKSAQSDRTERLTQHKMLVEIPATTPAPEPDRRIVAILENSTASTSRSIRRKAPRTAARRARVITTPTDKDAIEDTKTVASSAIASQPMSAMPVDTPMPVATMSRMANARSGQSDSVMESTRMVRGRITDEHGLALPGAVVQANGATTTTSVDGAFALRVPAPAKQLTVSSIGYNARQHLLGSDTATQFMLALTPNAQQLNEVAMVRREKAPAPVAVEALPTGGYPVFKQYLKDSLDYPLKALDDRKEGTVQLTFTVAVDGTIQDIKVSRKVSEEIDAEAMRLVREGPKWFPAIRNGRRVPHSVRISIPFKLEDHL